MKLGVVVSHEPQREDAGPPPQPRVFSSYSPVEPSRHQMWRTASRVGERSWSWTPSRARTFPADQDPPGTRLFVVVIVQALRAVSLWAGHHPWRRGVVSWNRTPSQAVSARSHLRPSTEYVLDRRASVAGLGLL